MCQDNVMTSGNPKAGRRLHALSKERIVETAIDILDAEGEGALTFRALATRLSTGAGAIYWHISDKQDLLAAATDHIVARILAGNGESDEPQETIRAIALSVFDAIDRHAWVGAQLSRRPGQHAVLRILEGVGVQIAKLGVPEHAQFNAATALLSFILGLANQYADGSERCSAQMDRAAFLDKVAAQWAELDPDQYPFVRRIAAQLPGHDDREQFLAGIDLILAGIALAE